MSTAPDLHALGPPDGGFRAWSVVLASFLCNGVIFGLINSYSIIYVELQKKIDLSGVSDASSKASLVGSLTIGTTFLLSPIAGIMTDKIGIRITTFVGGIFAFTGLFMSSYVDTVVPLYLTYGVMFGVGASLAYTPSLVILGHYFKRYLGIVNGFVSAGSSVFTMIMPYFIDYLLKSYGLVICLRSLAFVMCLIMFSALLFKPIPLDMADTMSNKKPFVSLINKNIWTNKRYVAWALIIPLALFGYFVPYVHLGKFVNDNFPEYDGKSLVLSIGIASGIGRLIFGKLSDCRNVNRVLMQQIAFICIGIATMVMSISPTYTVLVIIVLVMGLCDGCFISLLGPIAFDLCGKEGAGQAIGFLLGFCSIPLTVGPPIAGLLYDHTKSYFIPFILAGVPPILGGLFLYFVSCSNRDKSDDKNETPAVETQLLQHKNGKSDMRNGYSGNQQVMYSTNRRESEDVLYNENDVSSIESPQNGNENFIKTLR